MKEGKFISSKIVENIETITAMYRDNLYTWTLDLRENLFSYGSTYKEGDKILIPERSKLAA